MRVIDPYTMNIIVNYGEDPSTVDHIHTINRNGVDYNNKFVDLHIDLKISNISESLPRQHTVDQLKRVMKMCDKTDIGNRISDMNKQGANIDYIRNPIKTGIESYEDFEKHNKKFIPSWNLKHLISPFRKESKIKKSK
jgi:hypothetical protein